MFTVTWGHGHKENYGWKSFLSLKKTNKKKPIGNSWNKCEDLTF